MKDQAVLEPPILKLVGLFLLGILFSVGSLFLILYVHDFSFVEKAMLAPGVVFFGAATILILYKIIFRKPTLIISSKGIYPGLLFNAKWIPWKDIKKIDRVKFEWNTRYFFTVSRIPIFGRTRLKQDYIVIHVKNPKRYNLNKYLSKRTGQKIASILTSGEVKIKGDLYIPPVLLPYSLDKTLKILDKYKN